MNWNAPRGNVIMGDAGSVTTDKRPFPLNVVPMAEGWGIAVALENGKIWHMLKPGWEDNPESYYCFETAEEAWGFLKQLFTFCLKQAHVTHDHMDRIMNCEHCGRVFRAKFFPYCGPCIQSNENLLQQIWQGFYYLTGSTSRTLQRMSLVLNLPEETFAEIPEAFNTMVRRHLAMHIYNLEQLNTEKKASDAKRKSAGYGAKELPPLRQVSRSSGFHISH